MRFARRKLLSCVAAIGPPIPAPLLSDQFALAWGLAVEVSELWAKVFHSAYVFVLPVPVWLSQLARCQVGVALTHVASKLVGWVDTYRGV